MKQECQKEFCKLRAVWMTGSQGIKKILGMSHVDSTVFPFEPILRVRDTARTNLIRHDVKSV